MRLRGSLLLLVVMGLAANAAAQTFPGTNVGAIADGLGAPPPNYGAPRTINFAVSGISADVTTVAVDLTLTHAWVGDLDIVLFAPGGAPSMALVSRIGVVTATGFGDSSNYAGTYSFTDTAVGQNIWTVATTAGPPVCDSACNVRPGVYRTTAPGMAGQTNPAPVTSLSATFAGLTPAATNGTWTLVIRDGASGDLGTVTAANLFINIPLDLIFTDGFESTNMAAWTASAIDGGDLTVAGAAAMRASTQGLQGVVDDIAGLYVQDDSPFNENSYRARFHFDPNGFDPGEAEAHLRTRIFIAFEETPTRRLAAVVLRRQGGNYAIRVRAREDDNSQADTVFMPISNGPHAIEINWQRASGPDALDGQLEVWIDGTYVTGVYGLDNFISSVDFARLGALSVKSGASGMMLWDEFLSRRRSYCAP